MNAEGYAKSNWIECGPYARKRQDCRTSLHFRVAHLSLYYKISVLQVSCSL
jgi:hypothetical protein